MEKNDSHFRVHSPPCPLLPGRKAKASNGAAICYPSICLRETFLSLSFLLTQHLHFSHFIMLFFPAYDALARPPVRHTFTTRKKRVQLPLASREDYLCVSVSATRGLNPAIINTIKGILPKWGTSIDLST